MEISLKTKKLKKLCDQRKQAEKELGPKGAKKLRARMADLAGFLTVTDLCAGQFALDLDHPRRLVFEPDHDPIPRKDDGGIDWSQVTRVRIIWIGDYHD